MGERELASEAGIGLGLAKSPASAAASRIRNSSIISLMLLMLHVCLAISLIGMPGAVGSHRRGFVVCYDGVLAAL